MLIPAYLGRLACKRFIGVKPPGGEGVREAGWGRGGSWVAMHSQYRAMGISGPELSLWGCPELGQEGWAIIPCLDQSLDAAVHGGARPWAGSLSLQLRGRCSSVASQPQLSQQQGEVLQPEGGLCPLHMADDRGRSV